MSTQEKGRREKERPSYRVNKRKKKDDFDGERGLFSCAGDQLFTFELRGRRPLRLLIAGQVLSMSDQWSPQPPSITHHHHLRVIDS